MLLCGMLEKSVGTSRGILTEPITKNATATDILQSQYNTFCVVSSLRNSRTIMLQAASIYTQGDGSHWKNNDMINVMLDIAQTSLSMLGNVLFKQLTGK